MGIGRICQVTIIIILFRKVAWHMCLTEEITIMIAL